MSITLRNAHGVVTPEAVRAAVLEGRVRPLSRSLTLQVAAICARPGIYRVEARPLPTDQAPQTWAQLVAATHPGRVDSLGVSVQDPVPVWDGASDRTIWGHPDVNALVRAWHDRTHVDRGLTFETGDEIRVAHAQLALIDGTAEYEVLRADTIGQTLYAARWGAFPDDQRAFVVSCIRDGTVPTVFRGGFHR